MQKSIGKQTSGGFKAAGDSKRSGEYERFPERQSNCFFGCKEKAAFYRKTAFTISQKINTQIKRMGME